MVSSSSKLGLTSKFSLIRFSSLCSGDPWWCTLPFREVNIGCVESHWHVRGLTFTSAERVARAPAARQLEISAGMQNLITTLIFTLSLLLSVCLSVFLSSIPLIFIFPHGGSTSPHLMGFDNPLMPPTQRFTSFLFSFSPYIFSLYSSEIFSFFPFVRGHRESSSTALPIPSKG